MTEDDAVIEGARRSIYALKVTLRVVTIDS